MEHRLPTGGKRLRASYCKDTHSLRLIEAAAEYLSWNTLWTQHINPFYWLLSNVLFFSKSSAHPLFDKYHREQDFLVSFFSSKSHYLPSPPFHNDRHNYRCRYYYYCYYLFYIKIGVNEKRIESKVRREFPVWSSSPIWQTKINVHFSYRLPITA